MEYFIYSLLLICTVAYISNRRLPKVPLELTLRIYPGVSWELHDEDGKLIKSFRSLDHFKLWKSYLRCDGLVLIHTEIVSG